MPWRCELQWSLPVSHVCRSAYQAAQYEEARCTLCMFLCRKGAVGWYVLLHQQGLHTNMQA